MTDFLQVLAVGIGDGAIYAMLGLGLVVIFRDHRPAQLRRG